MVIHNPFIAAHGLKSGAWDKIVESLLLYDKDAVERGKPLMFDGVTVKTCKLRWDNMFQKQKERVNRILNSTGVVVNETERERLIEQLYNSQVDVQKNKALAKADNDKKRQKQEENKALGEALRTASINKISYTISNESDASEDISSASSPIKTKIPLYESKGKRKKRKLNEIDNVCKQILDRDEERHKELIQVMKDSNESIANAFNNFATILKGFVPK
ncbi:hypothetical protein BGZ76_005282 [Entomortierella beljakovae]|nr:hypothetical protein BGZ76_005282 [Entomortierella beljakovae]